MIRLILLGLSMTLLCVAQAVAATISLRGECRPTGSVVTLGDVAEISAASPADTELLKQLELLPVPSGNKRVVRAREIQDLLELHGVNLAAHRFSGSASVTIVPSVTPVNKAPRVTGTMQRTAEKAVQDAILRHLQETVSADEAWDVDVQLNDEAIRAVSTATGPVRISGGTAPWTGTQTFSMLCAGATGATQTNITAKVGLPPSVVSATRNLPKGTLLKPGDIKVQRLVGRTPNADAAQRSEDVLGRETSRALAEGQTIENSFVRSPVLVKKGESVTVYARTGGVQVRITARAKEDGALSDVISVESLLDRKVFFGRVTAPQEVEVFAKGVTASDPPNNTVAPVAARDTVVR